LSSLRRVLIGLSLVAAAVLLAACQPPLQRETRLAMSTTLTVTLSGGSRPDWDALFARADRLAWEFDHRDPESPVGLLNRQGSGRPPEEVLAVLREAQEVARLSGGAFDPTILPLTRLWDFDSGGRLPAPEEIAAALPRVDYRRLEVQPSGEVSLPPGFGLDLGGIAKGAVVDRLADELDREGHRDYLIDAGGDILLSGLKEGRKQWVIAIRHPRNHEAFVGMLSLGEKGTRVAVVTSGDYERTFERGGRRYHHILDPHTGYPTTGTASVTVIAPTCSRADALATAAFVLGGEKGLALLESQADTEGLVISEEAGRLVARATKGFPLKVEQLSLP
jgi:thiamine biosynthesis lipoprotein